MFLAYNNIIFTETTHMTLVNMEIDILQNSVRFVSFLDEEYIFYFQILVMLF